MHKYRSKVRYIYYRKLKEYNRYKRMYKKAAESLRKKGLEPYGIRMYSKDEYFSFKEAEINKEGRQNIQRKMIQQQMYRFSYKQATKLRQKAKEEGYDEIGDLSIAKIRSGVDFDLDFLSDVNNILKKDHPEMRGSQRAAYIRREWFGYAQ